MNRMAVGIGIILAAIVVWGMTAEVISKDVIPDQGPQSGYVTTFVNGLGQQGHWFYYVTSGTDYFYDSTPESQYTGGAALTCSGGDSTSDSCTISDIFPDSITPNSVTTSSDTCNYGSVNGDATVYGTVDGGCSLTSCTIAVEYHAMCYQAW